MCVCLRLLAASTAGAIAATIGGALCGVQGGITVPAYAAAKGALGQLTKALSNEWSKDNVQVNGIAPGYIATDM